MTPDEAPRFAAALLALAEVLPFPLSDGAIQGYYDVLAPYPLGDILRAVAALSRDFRPTAWERFPVPATVRERVMALRTGPPPDRQLTEGGEPMPAEDVKRLLAAVTAKLKLKEAR